MSVFKTAFAAVAFAAAAVATVSGAQASDQLLKGRVPVGMEQIGGEAAPVYSDKTYVVTSAKPVGWTSGRDAQPVYDASATRPVLNRDVVKAEMINNKLVVTYRDDGSQIAEQK